MTGRRSSLPVAKSVLLMAFDIHFILKMLNLNPEQLLALKANYTDQFNFKLVLNENY
jgi:hypothetical protein